MALRRVFSLSHAPPGNGLAAKDFFVTYFDSTLSFTSHERDRFHEWTRSIVVRTLKHRRTDRRTRCNDLIFVQRKCETESQREDGCCGVSTKERKKSRNIFDEITSIEEHFLGEQAPLKFRARKRKCSRSRHSIGSMARPDVVPVIAVIRRFTAHWNGSSYWPDFYWTKRATNCK